MIILFLEQRSLTDFLVEMSTWGKIDLGYRSVLMVKSELLTVESKISPVINGSEQMGNMILHNQTEKRSIFDGQKEFHRAESNPPTPFLVWK